MKPEIRQSIENLLSLKKKGRLTMNYFFNNTANDQRRTHHENNVPDVNPNDGDNSNSEYTHEEERNHHYQ
jgi:hypothetical protein